MEVAIEVKRKNLDDSCLFCVDVFCSENGRIVKDYGFEFGTKYEVESFIELLRLSGFKCVIEGAIDG